MLGEDIDICVPAASGSAQKTLVLVHIPKTAGTSFNAYVNDVFFHSRCRPWNSPLTAQDVPATVGDFGFIAGHYPGYWFDNMPNVDRITFLRSPVSRIVSLYRYWNSVPPAQASGWDRGTFSIVQSLTFSEFIRSSLSTIAMHIENGMSKQILPPAFFEDSSPDSANIADAAILALREYQFVGLTEQFAGDLQIVADRFEISEPMADYREKKIDVPTPSLTSDDVELIQSRNTADQRIFDYFKDRSGNRQTPARRPLKGTKNPFRNESDGRTARIDIGRTLNINSNNRASVGLLYRGWHYPDPDGVWGRGSDLSLRFETRRPFRSVTLEMVPFSGHWDPRSDMRLLVNGFLLRRYVFLHGQAQYMVRAEDVDAVIVSTQPNKVPILTAVLPEKVEGPVTMEFIYDSPVYSPIYVGHSGDPRPLSMRLVSLRCDA